METTPTQSKTGPKDFFLWLGVLVALYGGVSLFITLIFEYANQLFPDPLAYDGDPYSGAVRFAMSGLIVFTPALLILMRLIRGSIEKEPGKESIWVRKWALMLTIFVAILTVIIDLITIINVFLGGETTERFFMKAGAVLFVAVAAFAYFFIDYKGYWLSHRKQADAIGLSVGALVLAVLISGFFIIGSPEDIRNLRYDDQRVSDLQSIQWQLVTFWQQKGTLPEDAQELNDPISGYALPLDPETDAPYRYKRTSQSSFTLCATFKAPTKDTQGTGSYEARPYYGGDMQNENWKHEAGETCFTRTIDPERYPPFEKTER